MKQSKAVGRPPKYKTKEEIQKKIDDYFEFCKGEILRDEKGKTVYNKWGNPVIVNEHPPTITGLALALGFTSRQALLNYQAKAEFVDTITRAKTRVEAYTEERLFDRDGSNGAQFSLRNNFRGWNDRVETELEIEEQKARIEQIRAQTAILHMKADTDETEMADDGFIDALNGAAGEDWTDEES